MNIQSIAILCVIIVVVIIIIYYLLKNRNKGCHGCTKSDNCPFCKKSKK